MEAGSFSGSYDKNDVIYDVFAAGVVDADIRRYTHQPNGQKLVATFQPFELTQSTNSETQDAVFSQAI